MLYCSISVLFCSINIYKDCNIKCNHILQFSANKTVKTSTVQIKISGNSQNCPFFLSFIFLSKHCQFVHLSHLNFPAWKLPSQIKTLRIWDCFQLKHFQKAYCMMICPFNTFLTSFPECPSSFKHLTELNLSHCSDIKCFPGVGPFLPKLRMMNVYNCKKLKSLSNEMRKLTSLQELTICSCIALESFPNGDLPPNLISLEIWDCDNLDGHLSKWNLQSLAFLRDFSIAGGC
jgi:hypothetical protein